MGVTRKKSAGICTTALRSSGEHRDKEEISLLARKPTAEALGINGHIDTIQVTRIGNCLDLSVECVMGALSRRVSLFSALTSETRHATNTGDIRNYITLLNSGDAAALLPGTRHAQLKTVGLYV
jgi:hypothetical protein